MAFPEEIFRSYDIRGLLDQVVPDLARRTAAALVKKTAANVVIVGRDMRATSPELEQAAIEGATKAGAEVRSIGMCTTSLFNFAVSSDPLVDAGIMITASHNPPEYNGIKMALASGLPIPGKEMYPLVQEEPEFATESGAIVSANPLERYIARCAQDAPSLMNTKIIVDYGNGMGALTLRPLLKTMGADFTELYAEPDARFPNHEANPAKEETLDDLKAAVVREGADLGIALDGDADRVAFVDNEGVSVRGDMLLALLAQDLCARTPGAKVVVAPNQSWSTFDAIRAADGELIESRIGRTHAIVKMHETEAVLGGEVSGHFFFREFANLESVDYAAMRVLAIWKVKGGTFADLVRPLRRFANSGEVNLEIHDKSAALARVEEAYAANATLVNRLDGIRCEFERDWWFIVRPSNTEPILRLTVEATSQTLMEEKRDELVRVLSS